MKRGRGRQRKESGRQCGVTNVHFSRMMRRGKVGQQVRVESGNVGSASRTAANVESCVRGARNHGEQRVVWSRPRQDKINAPVMSLEDGDSKGRDSVGGRREDTREREVHKVIETSREQIAHKAQRESWMSKERAHTGFGVFGNAAIPDLANVRRQWDRAMCKGPNRSFIPRMPAATITGSEELRLVAMRGDEG